MAIQIIGRLAAGLQVTLLEINTLGHILCALIIYVLWWHKPRLIQEPTTLEGDWVWLIAAYMYMSSRISREALGESGMLKHSPMHPELMTVSFYQTSISSGSRDSAKGLPISSTDPGHLEANNESSPIRGQPDSFAAQPGGGLPESQRNRRLLRFLPSSARRRGKSARRYRVQKPLRQRGQPQEQEGTTLAASLRGILQISCNTTTIRIRRQRRHRERNPLLAGEAPQRAGQRILWQLVHGWSTPRHCQRRHGHGPLVCKHGVRRRPRRGMARLLPISGRGLDMASFLHLHSLLRLSVVDH